MKEYKLKIVYMCGASSCWNMQVMAESFSISDDVYRFYVAGRVVFSSPSNLTIIERIKYGDE